MRKKIISISILILSSFVFSRCEHIFEPEKRVMRELTPLEKRLVQSSEGFGLKLFREVVKTETGKNVFISPLSVSMALGMTLNGANGETRNAMQQTLELAGLTEQEINQSYQSLIRLLSNLDAKVLFQIANAIFYRQDYNFEEEFINLNKTYFDAEVQGLNFADPGAVNIINNWVDAKTYGKIQKVLDNIDPRDVMFLVNAIYFKGTWTYEFKKEETHDDIFRLADGSQKKVKLMIQSGRFPYLATDTFQAIDLPYGDGAFRMTIILPQAEKDLDTFIGEITQGQWQTWMSSFAEDSVTIEFPKFKLSYEIFLNDVLKSLDMGIAFDSQRADFTKMYKPGGIYIAFVLHKTFVEVDEEGTEAAGVTVVGMRATSLGPSGPIYMRVDRPFLFAIRESNSGTILFIGKIMNPGEE